MSWDEIDDDQSGTVVVPKHSVILKTKDRMWSGKARYYLFNILLGSEVLKELKWTKETRLKFRWGKDDKLGLLRIVVVSNNNNGWSPQVYKSGYALISNKALPPGVNQIERNKVDLIYSIIDDPDKIGFKLLEVILPEDFYINKPQKTSVLKPTSISATVIAPKLSEPQSQVKTIEKSITPKPSVNNPISKTSVKVEGPLTPYDRAIQQGGPITIDDLCKFLRVFVGDQASVISGTTHVEINDQIITYTEALAYANLHRTYKGKPHFSLTNKVI